METNNDLNLLSDNELVERIKAIQCSESLKILHQRHSNLYYNVYHKFASALAKRQISIDDILEDEFYTLYEAVISFDPNKGSKLSTWIVNCTTYKCLNLINRSKRLLTLDSESLLSHIEGSQDIHTNTDVHDTFDYIMNIIDNMRDARIKQIFQLRFAGGEKMSWSAIGKQLGISTQTALNLYNSSRKLILRKLKSSNLMDKI